MPKYMKLEMFPPTSTTIAGHSVDAVSQELRVTNNMHKEKNIVLKLKFSYVVGGKTVEDLVSVSSFPAGY